MLARVLDDYGGIKVDAAPVENVTSQLSATEVNRKGEDLAQLTRSGLRALVRFNTTTVAAPVTYAASAVALRSVWGSADAQKPTVAKTATGRYSVTFAASFTDVLGAAETVSVFEGSVSCRGSTASDRIHGRILTIADNVITLATYDDWVLADTGASLAVFTVGLWLR